MIAHRDFIPQKFSTGCLFKEAEYETFESVVKLANEWIAESGAKIINLELTEV